MWNIQNLLKSNLFVDKRNMKIMIFQLLPQENKNNCFSGSFHAPENNSRNWRTPTMILLACKNYNYYLKLLFSGLKR